MFNLPTATFVNKLIPKNSFDNYTNSKQKKQISTSINKITWTNKISTETTNLKSNEINEIEFFTIELRDKEDIKPLLDIVDRAIPYHIIFTVVFGNECYISTSAKHNHPVNDDNAVIDYSFFSEWFNLDNSAFKLELKNSVDWVYKNFCEQFVEESEIKIKDIKSLVGLQQSKDKIEKQILKVEGQIKNCRQFNKKVEFNLLLKKLKSELKFLK